MYNNLNEGKVAENFYKYERVTACSICTQDINVDSLEERVHENVKGNSHDIDKTMKRKNLTSGDVMVMSTSHIIKEYAVCDRCREKLYELEGESDYSKAKAILYFDNIIHDLYEDIETAKLPEPLKSVAIKCEQVSKTLKSEVWESVANDLPNSDGFNEYQSNDDNKQKDDNLNVKSEERCIEPREIDKREAIITESNVESMISLAKNGGTRLNLNYSIVSALPSEIDELENLKELTLVNSSIKTLPDTISKLVNLQLLDLSNTALNRLPESVGELIHLDNLVVKKTFLRSLPESIGMLSCLKYFDGSHSLITELPDSIGRLKGLLTLNLAKNKIKCLPESIGGMKRLQSLNLSDNSLVTIPEHLCNMSDLQILDLSGNKRLKQLPYNIGEMNSLKRLYLNHTDIECLPESICNLKNLQVLDLRDCKKLSELPKEIGNMIELRELYLDRTSIKRLPLSLVNLKNLCNLGLSSTLITSLPDYFGELTLLETLDLSYSKLSKMPDQLEGLCNLRKLDLRYSMLYQLPDSIQALSSLAQLHLGGTRLEQLNDNIGRVKSLSILDLSNTKVKLLPDSICELGNLSSLFMEDTLLEKLPDEVGNLRSLKILSLYKSKYLKELPESIAKLSGLHELNVSETGLEKLPGSIFSLSSMERIGLVGITVDEIPKEITQFKYGINYKDRIINHISKGVFIRGITLKKQPVSIFYQSKELIAEYYSYERKPVNETKVVFLGDGEVGKSYAIKRLRNNCKEYDYDGEHYQTKETVGIDISVREIVKKENAYKIHYWDFGGQKMYESMHRCFLTNRTCYVVVIKPRETQTVQRAKYWIRNISALAPKSPILLFMNLFGTLVDQGFPIEQVKSEYPNVIRIITVNAKLSPKEEFEKLDIAIQEMVEGTDSNTLSLPRPWDELRHDILRERNKKVDYIPYKTYVEKCRKHGVNDSEIQMWLLEWFNDLGECFSFANSKNRGLLGDYKVLNPAWLHNAIYRIINESSPLTLTGRITHAQIEQLLETPIVGTSVEYSYDKDECGYVLEVMRKFGLSYNIEEADEEFIPAIIKKAEPQEEVLSEYTKKIEYVLDYDKLLPENIIQKLMVNHYDNLKKGSCWKDGFWFCIRAISMTMYIYQQDEHKLKIDVYSNSEIEPWNGLQWLLKEIREINGQFDLFPTEYVCDRGVNAPIYLLLGNFIDKNTYLRPSKPGIRIKHNIEELLLSVYGKKNLDVALDIFENRKFLHEHDLTNQNTIRCEKEAIPNGNENEDTDIFMSILNEHLQIFGFPIKDRQESSYASGFNKLCSLIKSDLRKQFVGNEIPDNEIDIQNRLQVLLDANNYIEGADYLREKGGIFLDGRESNPDFVFPRISTALEVKYSKDTKARQVIIGGIHDDWVYITKYHNVIFVVYDRGTISDVTKFQNQIEDSLTTYFHVKGSVKVIVVKH